MALPALRKGGNNKILWKTLKNIFPFFYSKIFIFLFGSVWAHRP